jgi:uncharacterized protein YkwD
MRHNIKKRAIILSVVLVVVLAGCTSGNAPAIKSEKSGGFSPAPNATFASPTPAYEQPDTRPTTPEALPDKSPRDDINVTRAEQSILETLEEYRRAASLDTLTRDPRLSRIARQKSADMAKQGYFDHEDPEGGNGLGRRLATYDYACAGAAELLSKSAWNALLSGPDGDTHNLTAESRLAAHIIDGLDDSEPHRHHLRRENVTTVGVGMYVTADGTVYTTIILCR